MTDTLVIDASVAMKWVVDEPGSAAANALIDRGSLLVAPEYLIGEVGNGLRKRVHRGTLSREDATLALRTMLALGIEFVTGTDRWARALGDALTWDVTTYDALFIAVAVDLDAVLITADTRLLGSANAAGLPVRGLDTGHQFG